jgi:tetratricopeptide (TPR) repeat protein
VTILLTRSVWIAFIASLLFSVCIILIFHYYFSLNRKVIKIIVLVFIAGIVIVASGILVYSKFGGTEVFKKQTYWISNYKYGSSLERVDLWQNTLKMSMDYPVTGVGQGNWRIKFPAYGLENLRSETGEIFFQRPHNDFLWVLAENGIVGLMLYLMLFCITYYYLFQLIKKSPRPEKKYLALAMIFGMTGYFMISLLSFPKERIEHQIYVHIIFAIALTEYHTLKPEYQQLKKGRLRIVFLLILALMVVGSYLTLNRFISEKHIAQAYNYREKHNWQDEIDEYKLAESFTTKVDAFSTPLAWYIGEAWFNLNELDSAHHYFRRAYEINPYHLHVLNNLGTTYELKGNSDKAESFFLKAHSIAPRFEDPLFNLCALYYNKSNFDLAYETIKKIDLHTANPKYERFLKAILWYKVDEFNKTLSERVISKSVIRIRNSEDWMQKVHEQSIDNETEFEKQLLLEAIYLLESVDSTITSYEAESFKKKFNLQ